MLEPATKSQILKRLRRIEGQVAGLQRMIEEDKYCVDVLLQVSASRGALASVGSIILRNHIETCVGDAFTTGDDETRARKLDELMMLFDRYRGL